MTYVWINPVAEQTMGEDALGAVLERHHLCRIRCREDWGQVVRRKYRNLIEKTDQNQTLADARCPLAVELVQAVRREDEAAARGIQVASVEPILLHCARELAAREDLADGKKLITTPCRALARQGNALSLPGTRFVSWLDFLRELGEAPGRPPGESPIPPGFFEELGLFTASLTGREEIARFLKSGDWRGWQLAELLYCPGGCNRGDGVMTDEAV